MTDNCSFGIIILAAGNSSRLGQSKQLIPVNGKTLLDHVVSIAAKTAATHLIIVVNDQLKYISQINSKKVHVIINKKNAAGISTSINTGMKKLMDIGPLPDAAILMVCDQPFINESILNELVEKYKSTAKPIIASAYAGTFGTPVLFHHSCFHQLLSLNGDIGAKKIIFENRQEMESVDFATGDIDIDTPEDLEKWRTRY